MSARGGGGVRGALGVRGAPVLRRTLGVRGAPALRGPRGARRLLCLAIAALGVQSCQTPQWPLEGALRSPFGIRSNDGADLHRGVDLAARIGTPVRPVLPGRVRFAGTMSGYGSVIWIDHGDDLITVYGHLSEISVEAREEVSWETVIGLTGQSGVATGPHLHLEVWRWGREVDPVDFLGRPPEG